MVLLMMKMLLYSTNSLPVFLLVSPSSIEN